MKNIKRFEQLNEWANDPLDSADVVNVNIDGNGKMKYHITQEIKKVLRKFQGKMNLFVDGVNTNFYK